MNSYEQNLVSVAATADTAIAVHRRDSGEEQVPFWDTFTAEVIGYITRDDEDVLECAFPEGPDEDITADDVREGIYERIEDDIRCALPAGYELAYDRDRELFIRTVKKEDK